MTAGGEEGRHVKTRISERRVKMLPRAIAAVFHRVGAGHLCCSILLAGLVACSTTPGTLVDAQLEVYSPEISEIRDPETVAVFVNWHQGCVFGECDTPRVELHDDAAACIQSGLRRVNPDLRAVAGPAQLRQDTSALLADPRERGQPDSRFDADLVSKLRQDEIRYGLVLDISRTLGTPGRATALEPIPDPKFPSLIVWRRSHRSVHVRAEAILIELESRRWLARIRRDFKDVRGYTAGVVLVNFIYPIPRFFEASHSSAELSACKEIGVALGNLFLGKQGLVRLKRESAVVRCRTTPQGSRRIAVGHCSAEQCKALADLCY
jgi:hypothetical protein